MRCDAQCSCLACRICAELVAHIMKTYDVPEDSGVLKARGMPKPKRHGHARSGGRRLKPNHQKPAESAVGCLTGALVVKNLASVMIYL
jgi:hypothetical protein